MGFIVKEIQKVFTRAKIRKQLYLIYTIAIVIPILVIGTFLVTNTFKLLLNYNRDLIESDNLRVKTMLFEITSQIYNISEDISFNWELQNILTSEGETEEEIMDRYVAFNQLDNYVYNYAEIDDVLIYTTNPSLYPYKQFYQVTEDIKKQDWYQKASSQSTVFWIPMERDDKYGNLYWNLCLVRKIPLTGTDSTAVLVIKISENYLKSRIDNNNYLTEISVNDDVVFYSTSRVMYGKEQGVPIDYSQIYYQYTGEARINDVRYLASVCTLHVYQSDSKLYIGTLSDTAYTNMYSILGICIIIVTLAILLPGIMIHYFTIYFTTRVDTLREEMHKASNEDYNITSTIYGNDELSEAFNDLEIMIQKIKLKDAKMYDAKISEKELMNQQQVMEYKMLASQINPHFLYNTLETIRMKALMEGNKDVANGIKLLGKSMRFVLENTGTSSTTIKNELEYIETYLMIQRLRFGERINYTIETQEGFDTNAYEILPLLLQPIVENAIIHGLEEVGTNGQITIKVGTREDVLIIEISDNGSGMNEEELQQLLIRIQQPNQKLRSSIGLYNINQRIRLYYGDDYGMDFSAKLGEGTVVTLKIPLKDADLENKMKKI